MLLLAPGPVPMEEEIADIAQIGQLPYFRGEKFVETMFKLTENMKYIFQTKETPLTVTSSGSGLMEMAIVNLLNEGDKVVVINGGNFGQKWVNMCQCFKVEVIEFLVKMGTTPDYDKLQSIISDDVTAVLVNAHETSTGYLYDLKRIGEITHRLNKLFIVDAVSSIGADDFYMDQWNIDCALVGTQKALAVMPGLGHIVFSEKARQRFKSVTQSRYYFDAQTYLDNIARGMTPFTPAMVAILQLLRRTDKLIQEGIEQSILRHKNLAEFFRNIIKKEGLTIFPEVSSNAMSAVNIPEGKSVFRLIQTLKEKYDYWCAPNPEDDGFLRVSHMGDLSCEEMEIVAERIGQTVQEI